MLFSANRWEAATGIIQAIESGRTVIVDRYYYSGIVYSAAKKNRDLGIQWCKAPDVGLPKPDLIIFLDVDLATAKSRGGFGDERYEREETQKTVRQLFYDVIEMEEKGENVTKIVDASKSLEEVGEQVQRLAQEALQSPKLKKQLQRIEA